MQKIQSDQSTSLTSERWAVCVNKETFIITGNQKEALKKMMEGGSRAVIWFGDFAISIPHIQYIYRDRDKEQLPVSDSPRLMSSIKMTVEDRKKMLLALQKTKDDLIKKRVLK